MRGRLRAAVALGYVAAAVIAGCGRKSAPSPAAKTPAAVPLFEERARAAGLMGRPGRARKDALTILEMMGSGVAVFDFDNDGWDDILLVAQEGFGHTGRCTLYRNRGDGTFADATPGSGLDRPGYFMGCATADIDNDGRVDLFLSGYGINRLLRNLGGGRFEDITRQAGLQARSATDFTSAAAFGDFDGDGKVDLYLGRYIVFNSAARQHCQFGKVNGACPPWVYTPQFGSLYRNVDGRSFKDVTREAGLTDQHGKTLGAIWTDYNRDGRPDLYLANDGVAGDLYENAGRRFRNVGTITGCAYNSMGGAQAGMGVDSADYNGDGWPDLVVATFRQEPTSLYANRNGKFFDHRSLAAGLDVPTRLWTGFGTRLLDLDNDGRPDLVHANGHVLEKEMLIDRFSSYPQPMQLFMNQDGEHFRDASGEAGPGFTTPAVGRGLAAGDFDHDGRMDLVVSDLEGSVRLLMNRMPASNRWIGFRLRGTKSNRMALGAVVTTTVDKHTYAAECRTSASYFSASTPLVRFGVGTAAGPAQAKIRWPSGAETTLTGLTLNRDYTVDEARGVLP